MGLKMKGDPIPDQDHIARLCGFKHAPEGQIQATAFLLRPEDHYLSVDWLEFFGYSDRIEQIEELRNAYTLRLNRVGAKSTIAVLNVGEVCDIVKNESDDARVLEILHEPLENSPSHSGIYNLRHDDELIAELILETVCETYSARS